MSAIDRFDDWSSRVDHLLETDPSSPSEGANDTPTTQDGLGPDALADMYGADVLAAIEAQQGEPADQPQRTSAWRGGATAGAMVVGLVHGVRDALDDDDTEPIVEIDEEIRDRRPEAVSVHLAWGNPAASIAIVRPWLL